MFWRKSAEDYVTIGKRNRMLQIFAFLYTIAAIIIVVLGIYNLIKYSIGKSNSESANADQPNGSNVVSIEENTEDFGHSFIVYCEGKNQLFFL
jgi:predicted membrane protein